MTPERLDDELSDPLRFLVGEEEAGAWDGDHAGVRACLETQAPEEAREFTKDGVVFSSAFFDRHADGTFKTQGRWSDWVLPAGSFDAPPGRLGKLTAPAMSAEGMLAMKEQFPMLRNGRPLRDKDVRDIALLRELAKTAR